MMMVVTIMIIRMSTVMIKMVMIALTGMTVIIIKSIVKPGNPPMT